MKTAGHVAPTTTSGFTTPRHRFLLSPRAVKEDEDSEDLEEDLDEEDPEEEDLEEGFTEVFALEAAKGGNAKSFGPSVGCKAVCCSSVFSSKLSAASLLVMPCF